MTLADLTMKVLEEKDLDAYLKLEKIVKDNMEYPEWLGDFKKEDLVAIIKHGKIYLWSDDKENVCASVLIPATKKDLDKFFSSDLDYHKVIDFGPEMVHPDYVGSGLQHQMLAFLEEQSLKMGYGYGISTVHPDNIYSIRNLELKDFQKIGAVTLKRGPRNVYRKKLGS